MRRVCVLLAFVCTLLVPSVARADGLESFTRGLENFAGQGVNEQVTPERDFNDSYQPQEVVLSAPPSREYDEDSTTVDYVNGTLDEFNKVPWNSTSFSWLQALRIFMGATGSNMALSFLLPAVGLVFMWWGVRKSIHMLMSAFRSGRLSFGDRKVRNRNSYYYGTRPSDWR